ncbi:MAG: HAMP domain-containing histidine kinase [Ardenticatenaceae bacterium]|nr:HAMP domain-containing histidine kinase [Ardenticatenaceae bacterium]MCB9443328.1 HAMP domain-containing histidine kinase [Ardenticatenaceae bacterium]
MTLSPIDRDPIVLAARAAQAISATYQMAYAQLAPNLTLVQYSSNFPALLPDPVQEIIGQPITDLLWEFVGSEDILNDIVQGRQASHRMEYINRELADGTTAYLNFQVLPLEANDPGRGLLLVVENETGYGRLQQTLVQDRNELRLVKDQLTVANEELKRLSRLKSLFLSMAAHDLRTPLTAISGYASLILEILSKDINPSIRNYLTIITHQSDRLNGIIGDFLDLDQLEEGRLTLEPEPLDLREVIKEVTQVMQINADSREISLEIVLPYQPLTLWADRGKLYRIIYNLVGNAIKYTPRQGRVTVQATSEGDQIVLRIADNGRGLTEEQMANLFQIYYRTEDARQSKTQGTGLGLYIVKMLVEAHQGQISVASQPEQGSVFTAILPRQPVIDA